jgi:endonuclease III
MTSMKKVGTDMTITPQAKAASLLRALDQHYPDAHCTLNYQNPLELLVATVLSAQCTDQRVNQVTPKLFAKYPDARAYANAQLEELEADIRSTGFYHNKAKNLQACCRELEQHHAGQVPSALDVLVKLPGIGRKTANVILGNAYHLPGIVVDTHVGRVALRLGLTTFEDPVKIEQDLMALIPRERWVNFSHQLIVHGRTICQARKPQCTICPLSLHCDYFARTTSAGSAATTGKTPTSRRGKPGA